MKARKGGGLKTIESPFMTRKEAGEYLRVSTDQVDRLALRGRWAVFRVGRGIRFRRLDVVRSLELVSGEVEA